MSLLRYNDSGSGEAARLAAGSPAVDHRYHHRSRISGEGEEAAATARVAARTLVDGRRDPEDAAVAVNHHVRLVRHFVLAIRAARTHAHAHARIVRPHRAHAHRVNVRPLSLRSPGGMA